ENLSLDGKANRLSQMIRMNLPAAMQGLVVVPIFAGYDEKAGVGRLFKYDITGGRYEETNYDAQGSGANFARDSLKKLWKRDMAREEVLRVALEALFEAADEDVGTGGADLVRGIFPTVKTITRSGFAEVAEDEVRRVWEVVHADRARNATGSLRHAAALLRQPRADDEGQGGVRPQGHRARALDRHPRVRRRHPARRRESLDPAPQDLGDLRPDRLRGRRQVQRVREPPDRRHPPRGRQGVLVQPR